MKVFIVGTASWFQDIPQKEMLFEEFKIACKNIGTWLSDKHHVIIAGTVYPSADHWVIEGVKENFEKDMKKDKANITLYSADEDESHQQKDNPHLIWLEQYGNVVPISKDYWEAHNKALEICDIVLVIGGRVKDPHTIPTKAEHSPKADNVAGVCDLAKRYYKKPLVGLFHYGSHGRNINLKTTWLYELSGNIPEGSLDILNNSLTNPDYRRSFLKLLEQIHKKNPLVQGDQSGKLKKALPFCIILILIVLLPLVVYGTRIIPTGHYLLGIFVATLVASIISGLIGGIARFHKDAPRMEPQGSTDGWFDNLILGLIVGITCGSALWSFLPWLMLGIAPESIDYHILARQTTILSIPISILVTFSGPKAFLHVVGFVRRIFGLG